jgi:tryptophan synthase beta chain
MGRKKIYLNEGEMPRQWYNIQADLPGHHQTGCFDALLSFAKAEGHLLAPETSHAVKETMEEAIRCRESGETKVIAFNASGHGHFDMSSYEGYLTGKLVDFEYPDEKVKEALAALPDVTAE